MNILELDSYNLDDAVKFNDRLNPRLWDSTEHLRSDVKAQLLLIAEDFREFLGVTDLDLEDITISGSNAAYTYTPNSDIDLHLVVNMPDDAVYRELFDAKKFQYNEQHNIKIGGYDVELYVQDADQPHVSQGIYSIINDDWIQVPRRVKSVVDDTSTRNKYEKVGLQIERAIRSGNLKRISQLADKIKKMRQTGLEQHGEFGPENLAFKMLRSQGLIKQLYDARNAAKDRALSLKEKAVVQPRVTYGFRTPVVVEADPVSLEEEPAPSDEEILKDFIKFCVAELKIKSMPTVKLRRDPQWSVVNRTFGRYNNDQHLLEVAFGQRHIMDVLRTVAHELTHTHQHERESVPTDAGETGSPWENEANARAGVLMRDYGQLHPELFDAGQVEGLHADEVKESVNNYLWHGSRSKHSVLTPQQANDTGGKQESNKNAIYATPSAKVAIAMGLTTPGSDTGMFPNDPQMVLFKGGIRKGEMVYLHKVPKDLFIKHNGREWYSKPDVKEISIPNENIIAVPVDKYLNLIRTATPADLELQKKYSKQGVEESASGYIPTKAQAKDPRFSMALTQDIRPGQLGKEANKLKLKTNKQGVPQIANTNGLFEKLALEFAKFKNTDEDYSPDNPPGPESKPTMPKGTVRVDVSDVYDWYKLGQHISNMKGLGKHDFGAGPPSSIISFGDEDTEHRFIQDLKKTGLDVTDIDPKDPKKRPGKKIKTDPTYNVAESVEQLDEVKMSPSALQKWANSPEAQGIRAGFEAELIFRDTNNNGDSDYEMEPDYDADERCRSIQDIIDFFNNGEYGGLTSRQEARLQEALDEQYYEWYDEQMYKDFREEAEDLIRKVMVDEGDWDLDNEIQKQLELLDLTDDEMNDIINAGERAPKFTSSKEQILYAEANPLYQKYLDAQEEAEGLLDDLIADEVRKEGANWDAALDDFRDNYQIDDDSGFFDDVGLRWMSDVANNYDLDWPYMTGGGGNDGSRDWDSIGDSLHSAVDMPVKVSSGYHNATRKEDLWIVEPDTSLEPDDREDFGLEIVSPPMPLLTALEKLQEVCDWANDSTEGNAYTNGSTGLHMGVSVPFKGGDVDYLKLILFLGDEYVLKSFGREANTYCKSAMSKFKENIKGGRADPMGVIKLMQSGLLELAHKEIQKGVGDGKYTSAHIQKGYIEFRSPGGDWLAEESADPEKLQSTMLRFARAMSLAANPAEERREYAKKLYKLVAPEGDSQLALFSQFASGELTAEQLKKQWAEKTIGTEKKMNQRWRLYQNVNGRWEPVPGAEWNGYPEDEVKMRVWSKYGREALDSGEYQLVNMGEQDWEVYDVKTGETLEIVKGKSKGEVADAVYDKYVDQGIGFQVRPYEDPAKLTPRAKLAKRITTAPKEQPQLWQVVNQKTGEVYDTVEGTKSGLGSVLRNFEKLQNIPQGDAVLKLAPNQPTQSVDNYRGKWEFFYAPTGRVLDAVDDASIMQARAVLADTQRRYDDLPADQIQMRKAGEVQDIAPDIAQNFAPQDATQRSGSWAIYDVTLGREISRMDNVAWQQASDRADELERSTGHNMSVRGLQENFANNLSETLPAKNLNQLYTIKKQLANPAFSTAEPAEKPVPARPAQPRVHAALADLQRQRDKVQQIMDLKQEIETLTARAGRTRYGITPGLSADIEDIYPNPQSEADMDAAIQGYEVQKKKLTDYIARQRRVFPKESLQEFAPSETGRGDFYDALTQAIRQIGFGLTKSSTDTQKIYAHKQNNLYHVIKVVDIVTNDPGKWVSVQYKTTAGPRIDWWGAQGISFKKDFASIPKIVSDAKDVIESQQDVAENFADGKGPGRPGDSQRHGIPKGASIAQLEKAAKAPGRKGQLARWQLNMRRGKKK